MSGLEAERRTVQSRIGRYETFALAVALSVLTGFSLLFAWREPFSVDEYLVRITALSGSPSAVWHILKTAPLAVDPPLYHFLNVYFVRLFGPSEFSTRLVSVLSYTAMSFFLNRLVRKYTDVCTGLVLVALCLQCGTFSFAYEARPYTLVLAADALALVCWASLVEERKKRSLALAGLFLGIAIAVGSHWFGFLVLVPLTLGEAMRTWQKRRIDTAAWSAIAVGSATALAYLPLLPAASRYRALPWKGVALGDISESFQLVLEPCLFPLALLLVTLAVGRFLSGVRPPRSKGSPIPTPVFVCVAAFALMPFPGFVIGKVLTHAFQPRYVLLCTIGLLIVVSLAIRDFGRRSAVWIALALLILGGYASFSRYRELSGMPAGGDSSAFADASALSARPELPVVPGDNDLFLRLEAHGPVVGTRALRVPNGPELHPSASPEHEFLDDRGAPAMDKTPHPRPFVLLDCSPAILRNPARQQSGVAYSTDAGGPRRNRAAGHVRRESCVPGTSSSLTTVESTHSKLEAVCLIS